jgi:hypothetical protein
MAKKPDAEAKRARLGVRVGTQTRRNAEARARRAGMTLSEWTEQALVFTLQELRPFEQRTKR